jgi:hypothetical protein
MDCVNISNLWEAELSTITRYSQGWFVRLGAYDRATEQTDRVVYRDDHVRISEYYSEDKSLLGVTFEVFTPELLESIMGTRASLLLFTPGVHERDFMSLHEAKSYTLHKINGNYLFSIAGNFFGSKDCEGL